MSTLRGLTSSLKSTFVNGLAEEIKIEVRPLGPETLKQAIVMAQRIAKRLERLDQLRAQQAKRAEPWEILDLWAVSGQGTRCPSPMHFSQT